jgi:hypothetical protein
MDRSRQRDIVHWDWDVLPAFWFLDCSAIHGHPNIHSDSANRSLLLEKGNTLVHIFFHRENRLSIMSHVACFLIVSFSLAGNVACLFACLLAWSADYLSRPKAISSRPCPDRSYTPPRSIKLGHGRYALMGHHGATAPIPPAILKYIKRRETKRSEGCYMRITEKKNIGPSSPPPVQHTQRQQQQRHAPSTSVT